MNGSEACNDINSNLIGRMEEQYGAAGCSIPSAIETYGKTVILKVSPNGLS